MFFIVTIFTIMGQTITKQSKQWTKSKAIDKQTTKPETNKEHKQTKIEKSIKDKANTKLLL